MSSRPRAFLDANVLWGKYSSDLLLTLADHGLFNPHWSRQVLREVERNVPVGVQLDDWFANINRRHRDALVRDYGHRVAAAQADPKDKHVLAAALHSGCDVLVTNNVDDFWPERRQIRVQRLDDFMAGLHAMQPLTFHAAVNDLLSTYQRPPQTTEQLASWLATAGEYPRTAEAISATDPIITPREPRQPQTPATIPNHLRDVRLRRRPGRGSGIGR